nr:Sec-independent protein translocase protein TatB [Allorhizobium undicola]
MMLDIGWSELLVIAVVMIVVVGPKDLPPMLRAFGKMTSRLRRTAGEFRAQFEEALRESELEDVGRTIGDVQRFHPANALREAISPLREIGEELKADLQKSTHSPAFPVDEGRVVESPLDGLLPMTADDVPPLAPVAASDPLSAAKPAAAVPLQGAPSQSTAVAAQPAPIDAAAPVAKPQATRRKKAAAEEGGVAVKAKAAKPRKAGEKTTGGSDVALKPAKPRKPRAGLEAGKTVLSEGEVITPKKKSVRKKPAGNKDDA